MKIIFYISIVFVLIVSCEKNDNTNTYELKGNLGQSNWEQSGVKHDSIFGDYIVLTNKNSGQKVNHVLSINRSTLKAFNKNQHFDSMNHLSCKSEGTNCQVMVDELWTRD